MVSMRNKKIYLSIIIKDSFLSRALIIAVPGQCANVQVIMVYFVVGL